jgi:hypothetical protein
MRFLAAMSRTFASDCAACIERAPARTVSAADWLSGTADLAFGAVILGLGLFMLLWMIATG